MNHTLCIKFVVNPTREKESAHVDSAALCALLISLVSANVTKNELGAALTALYTVKVLTSAKNHIRHALNYPTN
jgi:hypothetical protein